MIHRLTAALVASILWACLALPARAEPPGAVVRLHFQDTGERRLVMAASGRGLVFIGQDLAPFRAFRSEALPLEGRRDSFLWIQDIDDDRQEEYVFAGDPSFVLDQGADPLFGILGGCRDLYLGNAISDRNPEVFCRGQNSLTVWNYDGQFLWEYSVSGMRLGECYAEDLDGDRLLEYACSTSTSVWLSIDIANENPVIEVDSNPSSGTSPPDRIADWVQEAQSALAGQQTFDLDGDGSEGESLRFDAGTLSLADATGATMGSAQIPQSTLYSVLVADLTGDGIPEIFLGGLDTVYVIGPTGEILTQVQADPTAYRRRGRVTIASVGANGLEDSSSQSAQAVVESAIGRLETCYAREMGSNPFIRTGAMFYELQINSSGRISQAQRIYSSVQNTELESCLESLFEDMRFSSATEAHGTVSLRLSFDFTDQ